MAAPLPDEPCPSKAAAAAIGQGSPSRISEHHHGARAVAAVGVELAAEQVGEGVPVEVTLREHGDQAAGFLGVVGPRPGRGREVLEVEAGDEGLGAQRVTDAEAGQDSPRQRQPVPGKRVNDISTSDGIPLLNSDRRVSLNHRLGGACRWQYGLCMATVLLVEDDHVVRGAMLRSLTDRGHAVHAVGTALDALRRVAAETPDLVVLDLGLPDLDGSDALRMLRGITDVPIIIATAADDEQTVVRLLRAGADDYMVKPFTGAHLDARITTVLRRVGRASRTAQPAVHEVGECGWTSASAAPASAPSKLALTRKGVRPAGLPWQPVRAGWFAS
jgi:CheY-like chemotaxis protein